uniref:FANCI helical domain-containing protein n=2 Tax=Amphimedon queenslandica TaxID=400682 RepID=A0A1X7SJS8_AMPQE
VLDSAGSQDDFSYSSQSQTLVEVHTSSGGRSSNESICLEILSMLRRSFTHQEPVRLTLYESLSSTFSSNAKLSGHILDLLLDHFAKHYYEDDEDLLPPLKLSSCIARNESSDSYIKREPLSDLLNCLQLCTKQSIEWEEKGVEQVSHLKRLKKILRSISRRLSTCDLDDFELDKSGDYLMTTSVGSKNHLTAALLLEIYEVALDYTFSIEGVSDASCNLLLDLFVKYQSVLDVLTEKGGSAGKKNLMRRRLLSSSTTLLFLKSLFRLGK